MVSSWQILCFTSVSSPVCLSTLQQPWATRGQGLCSTASLKEVGQTETWGRKKRTATWLGDEQIPYWQSAAASANAHRMSGNCFSKCYGLRVFQPCNEYIFFLHLFIIGSSWVMDFSTDAPSMFIFPLLQSALLSDNAKQVTFELILGGNPSFKEFSSVTIIATKMRNREWQNDWFYLPFGIFFFEWQPQRTQFSR